MASAGREIITVSGAGPAAGSEPPGQGSGNAEAERLFASSQRKESDNLS